MFLFDIREILTEVISGRRWISDSDDLSILYSL
jgi:hypothetical protein